MRITIKVGTSTLTHATGRLNIRQMELLCKVVSDIKNAGHEIVLVSSGAIGMGVGKLNLPCRPADMPTKQAAAAVGQCELMYVYDKLFSEYNHTVAQILLNADDVNDPHRRTNISNTLERLLALRAMPVINENDAVGTDEIGVSTTIGENDTLSAIVAGLIHADLLVILSDIDGLYTADPRKFADAHLISEVREITPELRAGAGGGGTALSSGGMATKLNAAMICMEAGTDMLIVNGSRPSVLYDIIDGKSIGTRFIGRRTKQHENN